MIWSLLSTFWGSKKLISCDLTDQIHFLVVLEVPKPQFFHHFMEHSAAEKLKFCYLKNIKFKKPGNWSLKKLSGNLVYQKIVKSDMYPKFFQNLFCHCGKTQCVLCIRLMYLWAWPPLEKALRTLHTSPVHLTVEGIQQYLWGGARVGGTARMRRGHGFGTLSDRRHISSLCPSVPDDDINDRTEGERKRGVEGERRG